MDQRTLSARYSSEPDEALVYLALDADGLTPEANEALMAEIQKRGLSLQDLKKDHLKQQNRKELEKSLSRKRILCWVGGASIAIFSVGFLQGAVGLRLGAIPYMAVVALAGYCSQYLLQKFLIR